MKNKFTILGCGSSLGSPWINQNWGNCKKNSKKNIRTRCCAHIQYKDIPIFEYTPKKIKKSVTGSGNTSKVQVASMLQSLFKIKKMPKHLDATDGLAAAVCHYFQRNPSSGGKSYSSWSSFIKNNPDKLA